MKPKDCNKLKANLQLSIKSAQGLHSTSRDTTAKAKAPEVQGVAKCFVNKLPGPQSRKDHNRVKPATYLPVCSSKGLTDTF